MYFKIAHCERTTNLISKQENVRVFVTLDREHKRTIITACRRDHITGEWVHEYPALETGDLAFILRMAKQEFGQN